MARTKNHKTITFAEFFSKHESAHETLSTPEYHAALLAFYEANPASYSILGSETTFILTLHEDLSSEAEAVAGAEGVLMQCAEAVKSFLSTGDASRCQVFNEAHAEKYEIAEQHSTQREILLDHGETRFETSVSFDRLGAVSGVYPEGEYTVTGAVRYEAQTAESLGFQFDPSAVAVERAQTLT